MKKLLALVLALVMTLSLCVTSNAAYSDAADVDYNEAVDVMSAVGVFQGADGKFSPKAELTREQAAKLIAYLDLGESVAEALPAVKVFNDVEATRWSAKYVAYCADAGYLAGVGDNNFDPAGKLTGYAFGKMLLCVLGYDAAIEGFTGANWQIAVAKLMESNKIAKNVTGAISATLTREQAAQYCLNTLKADCVYYSGSATTIEGNGIKITTGKPTLLVKQEVAGQEMYDSTDFATEFTATSLQLGEKLYGTDLKLALDTDAQGRTATYWTYKNEDVGKYASSASKTFVVTSTTGTLNTIAGQLKAQSSKYFVTAKGDLAENKFTTSNLFVNDTAKNAGSGSGQYRPAYGDQIEVFTDSDNANKIVKIVVTQYKLAEITKVDTNVSTADKNADTPVYAYVTLKNAAGTLIGVLKDTQIEGFDAATYVKGAYLAAAFKADGTVIDSYLATKAAEGTVSAYSTYNYTIGGTALKGVQSGNFVEDYTEGDFAGTYAGYTDANGSLLGIVAVKAAHVATEAVYLNYIWSTGENGDYAEKVNTTYAQVVDMNGTVSTIVIGKTTTKGEIFGYVKDITTGNVNAYTKSSSGTYFAKNTGEVATATTNAYDSTMKYTQGGNLTLTDKLYVMTKDETNGYVKLAEYTNATDTVYDVQNNLIDSTLSTTALSPKTTKLGGYYVNADTKYIFVNGTGSAAKVVVKTGADVSYGTNITGQIALYTKSGTANVAQYVIINAAYTAVATGDVLYLKSTTAKGTNANGDVYTLYKADGTSEDLTVASFDNKTANTYYTYTVNDKGAYVLNDVTENNAGGTWSAISSTTYGAVYAATYTSVYNNQLTFTNSSAFNDVKTDKIVVVDLHETNNDEYNYNGAHPARETYSGIVNGLDAISAASEAGFTVTFDAYVTDEGVTTLFVTDVSRSVITASAKQTTGSTMTITGVTVTTGACSGGTGTGTIVVSATGTAASGNVITVTIENIAGTVDKQTVTLTYSSSWSPASTVALTYGGNVITYTLSVA